MCGIFGVISKTRLDDVKLQQCLKRIERRGPDGSGLRVVQHEDWFIHFGHRRLSILDLEGGHQPLFDDSTSAMVSFNGEIYNYRDLRRRLPSVAWKTQSDTEVALHHWLKNGNSGLNDFDGFFGLALWRSDQGKVVLARDRFGIKPLYCQKLPDGGLAFASELGPLLELGQAPLKLSPRGLEEYLFFDGNPGASIVEGIFQMEPGQALIWKSGRLQTEKYHQWETQNLKSFAPSERDAGDALWHELKKAVRTAFVSDVPVGLLLSGGVDSTLVTLAAAEEFGSGLPAFSIGFEEKSFDESGFAAEVAKIAKVDLSVEMLTPQMMLSGLDESLDMMDAPLADPSFLPTLTLCRLARTKVKVVAGGDGGDELFWGYPTYWAHNTSERLRRVPGAIALGEAIARRTKIKPGYQSFGWKMKRLFGRWDDEPLVRHLRWMSGTDLPDLEELRGKTLHLRVKNDYARELKLAFDRGFAPPWLDLQFYLPASVLAKVDRASMACGLEVRPPLLSNDFALWGLRLPDQMKLRGKTGKWIFREALKNKVPNAILQRPKHGFAIPVFEWLAGPLRPRIEAILRDSPIWDLQLLDREVARRMWEELLTGSRDLQKTFWAVIVLDRWLRRQKFD
ncbi:MAG: asparagine synthase (glutamine-hydrolyzing) [Bdellovibrionaceae bacterium]|nr:asparagine synthase (glutamine-hydrolyzing) [Pseudobdellovibrionaceae bacterium]